MNVQAGGYRTTVDPGKHSESLNWPTIGLIATYRPPHEVHDYTACEFQRWQNEMVGGNYLVISQSGQQVQCTLCDADHRELARRGPNTLHAKIPKKQGGFQGC
jgi:hypothetical protein